MGLNVVVVGPPGAGKGTQADRLARDRNLPKISTGDILREAIKTGTPLGRHAKALMDAGKLVDDQTVVGIVRERLSRPDVVGGFLLDGFPRTIPQAEALDRVLEECCTGPLIVVEIDVPQDELVRRLGVRRVCGRCGTNADPMGSEARCPRCGGEFVQRADDNAETVLNRLVVYERETRPLLDYYGGRSTFRRVNGNQPPDVVAADIREAIAQAARVPLRGGAGPVRVG